MDPRRRYGLLDFYGSEYLSPVGQDSADVISTAGHMGQAPARFGRWQPDALAAGETAKAGVIGKALGLLGLDADGNRAATSWTDAAKHTAGNLINIPQDVGNQLLALQDYQPVMSGEDRATAGRQAGEVFGLAGLAPIAGAGLARASGRPAIARAVEAAPVPAELPAPIPAPPPPFYQDGIMRPGVPRMAQMAPEKQLARMMRAEGMSPGAVLLPEEIYPLKAGNYELSTTQGKGWWPETAPGQDAVATRLDGSTLYANSKQAAAPGMVVQGFRGYNPEHGIGPGVDRPQVVWATPDKGLADIFGRNTVTAPVEMRFENPYVVDAKGARFDNVPVREGKGLLSYLAPTVRHHIDDLALDKRDAGHDGMIVKNVRETGKDNVARTADQLVALRRGTVFDPASGDLLWANSKEGAVPGLLAQGENASKTLTNQGLAQEPLTTEERRAAAYRAGLAREAFRLLQPSGAR